MCFVGERGCDAGGPRREFFRLVLSEIFSSSLFLGWPNRVIPTNFYTGAVDHYYIAGKIIATSILQGGQSPHCFSPPVADYLIYGEIKSEPSIEDIPHIEIQESLLQVYTCSCFIDLLYIIYIHVQLVQCKSSDSIKRLVSQSEFRFLFDCGYRKSMESISTNDIDTIIKTVWLHYVFLSVSNELAALKNGLEETLEFHTIMSLHSRQIWNLLVPLQMKLTAAYFHDLFTIEYSLPGSNNFSQFVYNCIFFTRFKQ